MKGEEATAKSQDQLYPIVHVAGMSAGIQPTTNALKINGCSVTTLIDTGSCCTFVNLAAFPEDMNFTKKRSYEGPTILSASGHAVKTPMQAEVYFVIGSIIIKHEVILTTGIPHDCVIGMDWLQRLDKMTMTFKDPIMCQIKFEGITEIFWLDLAVERQGRIYLDNDCELAPRTINMLTTKVEDSFRFKKNVCLIEGMLNPPHGLELITQCVKRPRFVVGMNTEEKSIKLKKGTPIGVIYAIPESGSVHYSNVLHPKEEKDEELFHAYVGTPYYPLLEEFSDVVACEGYDLGQTHVVQHEIPLLQDAPIKQRFYRCADKLKDELDKQIKDMRETGVIRPSTSPWASPVLLVKKKNGTYRMCVDYRKLNAVTRKDVYPLPRIDDLLMRFGMATIFSSFDLMKGYYQVAMKEEDKEKTAFILEKGLFEFNVMPFGLTGAPNTFQRLMDFLLVDHKNAMVYLDDIVVYSLNVTEHLEHLRHLFVILRKAEIKLNLEKCSIGKAEIEFLGHVINARGVKPDPKHLQHIQELSPPKDIKGVQSFLGLLGYYRKFVLNFSKIALPLTELLKDITRFDWGERQQKAFEELKQKLLEAPILMTPNPAEPYILQTDASNYAMGAVLSQLDDSQREHPIAYISRTLKRLKSITQLLKKSVSQSYTP